MDCAVQTDPAEPSFWDDLDAPQKRAKKPYISLTKRLLLRCQNARKRLEAHQADGLNATNEDPKIVPEQFPSRVVQLATHPPPPPNVDAKTITDDIDVKVESTLVLSPTPSSFAVPLEKPRPPGQSSSGSDQKVHLAPIQLSPLPSTLQENQTSSSFLDTNGVCSEDCPDQPALPQQASDDPVKKSDVAAAPGLMSAPSPVVQTSKINRISLPTNTTHITNIPQPSPVRKKLSVAEYFKLVNTNKTEAHPPPDSHPVCSPVFQPSTPKPVSKADVQTPTIAANINVATDASHREDGDSPNTGKDPKL